VLRTEDHEVEKADDAEFMMPYPTMTGRHGLVPERIIAQRRPHAASNDPLTRPLAFPESTYLPAPVQFGRPSPRNRRMICSGVDHGGGLNEALPISSTGHLIIAGNLLKFLSKDQRACSRSSSSRRHPGCLLGVRRAGRSRLAGGDPPSRFAGNP
jgi:hypothetical protein